MKSYKKALSLALLQIVGVIFSLSSLFILPIITGCTDTKVTEFNPQKKYLYSLEEYEIEHGTKPIFIGDERIEILRDDTLMKKEYGYAVKKAQTIMLNHPVHDLFQILKDEAFFNKHKKIFDPFDASSLARIIYHNNKALVSFGFSTGERSFLFGDYILELKKDKILVYLLGVSSACG